MPSVEFHAKKLKEAKSAPEAKEHIIALHKASTPEAIKALIGGLEHKEPFVAIWSAEALGKIGDKSAIPALIKTLKHKNHNVVRWGAYALGDIGDKKALVPLMRLSGHKNVGMNKAVKEAIKMIQEADRGRS